MPGCGSQLSPLTICVSGIKLRLLVLAASPFTHKSSAWPRYSELDGWFMKRGKSLSTWLVAHSVKSGSQCPSNHVKEEVQRCQRRGASNNLLPASSAPHRDAQCRASTPPHSCAGPVEGQMVMEADFKSSQVAESLTTAIPEVLFCHQHLMGSRGIVLSGQMFCIHPSVPVVRAHTPASSCAELLPFIFLFCGSTTPGCSDLMSPKARRSTQTKANPHPCARAGIAHG